MFDLGWTELLLIGIVALIVVGPKDLPGMFRTVGNFVGKAKRMARDFSQAMNDAADDAGVSDLQKTLNAAAKPMSTAMNEVKKSTDSFTQATRDAGKPKPDDTDGATQDDGSEAKTQTAQKAPAAKEPAAKATTAETSATKKPAAKKPAAKKPAAKKPATKKTAAKKPATSKAAKASAGKTTAGKPAAKAAPAKTPAAKKPAAKRKTARESADKSSESET